MLVAESPTSWPNLLQVATTALNTAYNRSIGDNPFFLVFGRDIRYPFATFLNDKKKPFYNVDAYRDYLMETNHHVFKLVKHMLKQSIEHNQRDYNIRFNTRESPIKRGDRVYVKRMQSSSKFDSKFVGSCKVMQRNEDNVVLKNFHNGNTQKIHISHVLLVREDDDENIAKHKIHRQIFPDDAYDLE